MNTTMIVLMSICGFLLWTIELTAAVLLGPGMYCFYIPAGVVTLIVMGALGWLSRPAAWGGSRS